MKAVIAIDSFKGSMSTTEAGEAAALGIKRVFSEAETIISPLADGGEGTTEAIVTATHGKMRTISVHAPLGNIIDASYGITDDCAVIEMAAASGLTGVLLTYIGYSDNTAFESSVLDGIFNIATLVPAIGFALLAIILWFWYPLKRSIVNKNVEILKARRKEKEGHL